MEGKKVRMKQIKEESTFRIIEEWQSRCEEEETFYWKARPIHRIFRYMKREHGEVNYYLTHFLSEQSFILEYLVRIGNVRILACIYCQISEDGANHKFFESDR